MTENAIIMGFSAPPSIEDLTVLAEEALETLPEELLNYIGDVSVRIEEFPDEETEEEYDLDSPYDLLAVYRGNGIPVKSTGMNFTNEMEVVVLYRRPVLDVWCESGDDLADLIRQTLFYEIGRHFGFSDEDLDAMDDSAYEDSRILETVF